MQGRALALGAMLAAAAIAQQVELGRAARGGAFSVSSGGASAGAQVGVDACLFCAGLHGVFADYSHWFSGQSGGWPDRARSADLVAGGLRVQGGDRVRVFIDIGVAGGRDAHTQQTGGGVGGIVLGGGVALPIAGRWILRPQVRGYVLSPHSVEGTGIHWIVSGGAALGYRV